MEALQAVADVEWGVSSERLISSSANAYVDHAPARAAFRLFLENQARLDRRVYPRIRGLPQRGRFAARRLKLRWRSSRAIANSWPSCAPTKRVCRRALWPSIRPPATSRRGSVAATSKPTNSITWRKPGGNRARRSKRLFTARRSSRGCRPINASPTARWKFPCRTAPCGVLPISSEPTGQRMTAREGLIYSKNTITAQVMQEVGARKTAELARSMGVNRSKLDEVPALSARHQSGYPVGNGRRLQHHRRASANTASRSLSPALPIRTATCSPNSKTESKRVLSDKTVGNLINMLRGAVDQGTGQAVRTRVWRARRRCGKNRHDAKKYRRLVYLDASATRRRVMGRL